MTLAAIICISTGAIFEGALLTTLYTVSTVAETATMSHARRSLDKLRDLTPNMALRLPHASSSNPTPVAVSDVRPNDLLLVRVGEVAPCDGVIDTGRAFISLRHITGEGTPRHVQPNDIVPAGARAEDAEFVMRVTKVGAETSIARISRLVIAAQENRPVVTTFFDNFGRLYAKMVLIISFALAALLPVVTRAMAPMVPAVRYAGRGGSLARALGFLVAASPCALLIGAPVAYIAALSACARRGILVKSGAKSLEAACRASEVVFDKTGTLTTGDLTITSVVALPKDKVVDLNSLKEVSHVGMMRIVSAAAALERGAVHPIATAVQKTAREMGAELPSVFDARVVPGEGVEGVLNFEGEENVELLHGRLGRAKYILGDDCEYLKRITAESLTRGETVSVLELAHDRFLMRMKDDVRKESREVVRALQKDGMKVRVLTGDATGAGKYVSDAVGDEVDVICEATPKEKLEYVTNLQRELGGTNTGVVMIGDGVNDAAALAVSLVGVACGLNSATAVHAADVVLVEERLDNVAWFLKRAKSTRFIVVQNLAIALGLMVVSAAACVCGAVPLWLAVTMHEGGTILVGLNSLRLLRD